MIWKRKSWISSKLAQADCMMNHSKGTKTRNANYITQMEHYNHLMHTISENDINKAEEPLTTYHRSKHWQFVNRILDLNISLGAKYHYHLHCIKYHLVLSTSKVLRSFIKYVITVIPINAGY